MRKFYKLILGAIVLTVTLSVSLSSESEKSIGKIASVNKNSKEIIINISDKNKPVNIGDRLYVRIKGKVIIMKSTFPMMTTSKCSIESGSAKLTDLITPGLDVYRYYKGVKDEEETNVSTTPKPGTIEKFGDIDMISIPGGVFIMGSGNNEEGRNTAKEFPHKVEVSSFWMSKYEITQGVYKEITGNNPSHFSSLFGGNKKPVEMVSWRDAVLFCNKLSIRHGLKQCYTFTEGIASCDFSANGFRLPTEAEWEYACRGGGSSTFHYGDDIDTSMANFNGTIPYKSADGFFRNETTEAGIFPANNFGLYDMHGNVWEWCWDSYSENYYRNSPAKNPLGPETGPRRVKRGGCWISPGKELRSANREPWSEIGTNTTGIRICRSM